MAGVRLWEAFETIDGREILEFIVRDDFKIYRCIKINEIIGKNL